MGILSGLYKTFKKPPKASAAEYRELPPYKPSEFDAPSSRQLFDTYSSRARGEGVGFNPEDYSVMQAQETDQAVRGANEAYSRSMAGRRGTGGVSTGGTNRIRDRMLLSTQVAKSQALRDIAIRNAVLKREETWQGIAGLDDFLQNERGEAWRKTNYEATRTQDWNQNSRIGQDVVNQNRMNRYNSTVSGLSDAEEAGATYIGAWLTGGKTGTASSGGGYGPINYASIMGDPSLASLVPPQYASYPYTGIYSPSVQNYRLRR